MVKLTGSIMPQGLVAYLLPLNCPCTSSFFTLCNRLLRTETQNQGLKQSGISRESAGRGTKEVSDEAPGEKMGGRKGMKCEV